MQTAAAIASQLPQKEANLLRKLFKFYETKQYKKGIKQANQILEKFPDHAETNSLKGLFMYLTDSQEEGFKLARTALMKNLKSELCWHILGIINRNQKKYVDAIGCYKNALKYDPNNVNILRDLAVLQVHVRELDTHQETRKQLLTGKSNLPMNWIGLAVSEHLLGNHDQTLKVLESFRNVIKEDELKNYEKSELILYEVSVMLEMGHNKEALKYLEKHDKSIVDRTAFNEYAIKAYLALGHPDKAEHCIKFLLDKYPENLKMVQLYREVKGLGELNSENRQKIADLHAELLKTYPKSTAIQRNQLKFLEGEEFRQKFDEYLRPFFIKGLPSFFSDVRELLNTPEKAKIIEEVVTKHCKSLEEKNTFHGSETEENPCCLLWSFLFLASYLNWKGEYAQAMEYVEKAIQHTPTLVELYTLKAKIFKANYNFKLAAEAADKARNMDLADRYPNNLTVKYLIKAGDINAGDALLKTFIRDSSDANIHELQYMWYEYELGNAHLKLNQFGPALRQFKFIEKHFLDFYEDQFDFHAYCLRKYELRAYVNMIRNADDINNNKWYIKATLSMIKGILAYEKALPEIQTKEAEEKKTLEEMDAQERRKYKKEKEAKEKETDPAKEKLDLKGKKLLEEIKVPIDEACKFASRLLPCKIESLKYRVKLFPEISALYLRREKPLVAIKAYNKVANLVNDYAEVHLTRLRLIQGLEKAVAAEGLEADIKAILEEELNQIKGGSDAKALHAAFKSSGAKNLANEIIILECDTLLGLKTHQEAAHAVFETVKKHHETARISEVVLALEKLSEFGGHEESEKKIKELFKQRFNLSPIFNEEALNLKAINPLPTPKLVE